MANEFLTFAGDPAANVLPLVEYSAANFMPRMIGFVAGTALSPQLNRVWRQSSLISSMIGSFTVNNTGLDMIDDGTPAGMTAIETNFKEAIRAVASGVVGSGFLPLVGGTLTGPLVVAAPATQITIIAPAGQSAQMALMRGQGSNAALYGLTLDGRARWAVVPGDVAGETGGNAGSNFDIIRFDDPGNYMDIPLSIDRATGVVNFAHPPTYMGGPLPYLLLTGGNVTGAVTVGGVGIGYPSVGSHYHSFSWDGPNGVVNMFVDNNWVGSIATTGFLAGAYLPLAGGTILGNLKVNGSLRVDGYTGMNNVGLDSSISYAGNGAFATFQYDRFRYHQWQENWGVNWDTSNGNTTWYGPSGRYMQLTGNFDLSLSGRIDAYGGRLMSIANASPTIVGWHQSGGSAMGFQVEPANMYFGWFDGAGNGIDWIARMDTGKNLQVYSGIYGQYIHSYGDIVASNRFWSNGGLGTAGSIDASGNIYAAGVIYNNGSMINQNGRLITHDNGGYAPSVTAWNIAHGTACGFWTDPGAMVLGHLQGDGSPAYGQITIQNDSQVVFSSNIHAPNGSIYLAGDVSANNRIWAGAGISTSGELSASGWVTSATGFYTNGPGGVVSEGNLRAGGQISAGGNLVSDYGWVYAANSNGGAILTGHGVIYRQLNGGHNIAFRWDGRCFWRWIDGGELHIITGNNDTRVNQLHMQDRWLAWTDSDGSTWYADTFRSDARFKENIAPAAPFDSLSAIAATTLWAYNWIGYDLPRTELGFIAEELAKTMPDAVVQAKSDQEGVEPVDHLDPAAMLAHLFRAIQQLVERVTTLESAHA
jgi:hypothetical protein